MRNKEVLKAGRGTTEALAPKENDAERPFELRLQFDNRKHAYTGFALDRPTRQDGHRVGDREKVLERVDVVELIGELWFNAFAA